MAPVTVSPNTQPYQLSEAQIKSYHDQGFLLIPHFFSIEEHQTLETFCGEFQNWGNEKGKWMQYYELNTVTGENQLCRTENFTPFHAGMKSYVNSVRLLEVLKKLHGEEYVLFKEKVNYKLPGGGGKLFVHKMYGFSMRLTQCDVGFPAHQDAPAFVQFGQSSHMTVMFTVDATTAENGCLEVVPGSHVNDFERRILPQEKNDGSISLDWCGKQQWVPVHCLPVRL